MNPDFAVELIRLMMFKASQIAVPILATGMIIGVSISIFQTVTSVQEQTLDLFPKDHWYRIISCHCLPLDCPKFD